MVLKLHLASLAVLGLLMELAQINFYDAAGFGPERFVL